MEPVVDQTLGDIFNAYTTVVLEHPRIKNALMCYIAVFAMVENRILISQPTGNVVCVQNRIAGCIAQSGPAHHADIHPRNGQY